MVETQFDNFLGEGHPLNVLSYQEARGRQVLERGLRLNGQFFPDDPPSPVLEVPLSKGLTWTYSGSVLNAPTKQDTTVLGSETVHAAGRTFHGCAHYRTNSTSTPTGGKPTLDVIDTWACPGIGTVRSRDDGTTSGKVTESVLVAFHGPGENIEEAGALPAIHVAGASESAGEGPAVDDGRTDAVAGATLGTAHLAWSLARKLAILYPPVGRPGLAILAEDDGSVTATDTNTGQVLWQVQLQGPIVASPVLSGPLVFVADGSKSLLALDAETGAARWIDRFHDVQSTSPVVVGRTVVAVGEDRKVRGLDFATGRERWSSTVSDIVATPPALAGNLVVLADRTGGITALDPGDGSTAWTLSLDNALSAGPVAAGGLVFLAEDGGAVTALRATDGHAEWRQIANGAVGVAPAVSGDRMVDVAGHLVQGRDVADGTQVWQTRLSHSVDASPVILGDTAVVLTPDARLHLFDLRTGATKGIVDLPSPDPSLPIDTQLAMSYVGGALVVPVHDSGPWPFTILMAFPAPVSGQRVAATGALLAGTLRPIPSFPVAAPSLVGRDLLVTGLVSHLSGPGTIDVADVPPTGPARTLFSSSAILPFAVPAGRFALTQDGTELIAVPRTGGTPVRLLPMGEARPGTAPLVVGTKAFVPVNGAGLTEIDVRSGKVLWSVKLTGSGNGSPILLPNGDVAYAGAGVSVTHPGVSKPRWSLPGLTGLAAPVFADGALFVEGSVGTTNVLASLDAATGKVRWAKPFQAALGIAPAAARGVVVAVDTTGVVTAFDAASGNQLWTLPLRTGANGPPAIVGARVAIQEQGRSENLNQRDFRITVLGLHTGRLQAQWEFSGSSFLAGGFSSHGDTILAPGIAPGLAMFLLHVRGVR